MANITRTLGPGGTTLLQGDATSGYYGKVTGIVTGTDLLTAMGINTGTVVVSGDITWLKFSHNYKTLFIADHNILTGPSWDQLHGFDAIFGKYLMINGTAYLVRSIQGSNSNPAPNIVGAGSTDTNLIGQNSEWFNTIKKFTPNDSDSHWSESYTTCQELTLGGLTKRLMMGTGSVDYAYNYTNSQVGNAIGWRPVLEVVSLEGNYLYLVKQFDRYYSIKPEYYDTGNNYIPLTLSGGTTPNTQDIQTFGFSSISDLLNDTTIGAETFKPVSKFNNIFEILMYKSK